jgi:hypothetical protein
MKEAPEARAAGLYGPHKSKLAACSTVLLALLLPVPVCAQKAPSREFLEGTHVFRRILHDSGLTPIKDSPAGQGWEELLKEPRSSVLIVLGRTDPLARLPRGGLRAFVRAGGALLIASDLPADGNKVGPELRQLAGVTINSETVACGALFGLSRNYRGEEDCPFVLPAPGAEPALFNLSNPLPELLQVATNVPSYLVQRGDLPRGVHKLAYLPPNCRIDGPGGGLPIPGMPLFAVGGSFGDGRFLVLADHSLFINEMMLPRETANVEFAFNCVAYLRGENRQRTRVLLLEDGRVRSDLEVPLRPPTPRPEDALKALIAHRNELLVEGENALGRLEEQNFFNEQLSRGLDEVPAHVRTWVVLGVLTGLLLIYGLYHVAVRARYQYPTGVPGVASAVSVRLPGSPLLEQRHREMLQSGNLAEPARQLARDWFAQVGAPGNGKPPRVRVRGTWWLRWKRSRQVDRLWRLARGTAGRITPPQLRGLLALLTELAGARAAGLLQLEWEAPASRPQAGKVVG